MNIKNHFTRELTPRDGVSYYLDGTAQGMLKVRMYVFLTRKYNEQPDNLEQVVAELINVFNEPLELTQEMVHGFFGSKMAS
ncbi:MAG: hypothetical protein ACI865_002860 [Flavobacteriaceae bacterium]|jgi:hypothetical protein